MITQIADHMALVCRCGCVGFNLLRSGKIACEGCGAQENMRWTMTRLEDLLRMTVPAKDKDGNDIQITPEFRLSVQETKALVNGEPGVRIIIHADGHNSDTLDYVVSGDDLLPLNT
jgi:hypothetical protein